MTVQIIGVLVLRSWLLGQVDQQLAGFPTPTPALAALPPPAVTATGSIVLPSDFRLTIYDHAGRRTPAIGAGSPPGPRLPEEIVGTTLPRGTPMTVEAVTGDGHWRVKRGDGPDGSTYVVALPLDTFDGATSKLMWLNAVVLVVTAVALIVLSRWVVGLGLRPLSSMEETARDIAAGDSDLRVRDTDQRTEVGRLGTVLNTMLDRIHEALRERERSEERLRRFVSDAGHELRTPLTTIQGFAQLALRRRESPAAELDEADRLIAQNAERMSLLVNDLLLLAKLDREPVYRREPVDLLALAAETVSAVAPQLDGRPLRLGPLLSVDDLEPVETIGDPLRLRQVADNLLANALMHTPSEAVIEVRVGTARSGTAVGGTDRPGRASALPPLPDGVVVHILEVADHGPGLTSAEAAKVFERFYRVDRSRTRDQGGSGLGLAIATAIAERHGGRVEVDTAPGNGCTFRLVLPAVDGGQSGMDGA
ncbi:HAMP domain-containing sensor histidine kinase [Actinoplanes subtropicus]|uniref:HAMP domain-containing sensor histidine kinase n=1 Tax=Actinoplanes subtropicus TaxID=543632 RepID=UPI001B805D78|nr:HAMP domain-containing sensor histidine kinase [Actinoplanes subtropicus]